MGDKKKTKETLKNVLKKKKAIQKNEIGKIDEEDETSDDNSKPRKIATAVRKQRVDGGGTKKNRPHTVQAHFVSTAPMADASIMDLEQKFASLGFGSDNDGDDEREPPKTPAWHDSINWGHSSPLGNELYGNSFDDNNRPSVSRANLWGSMEGAEIGEFAMSLSFDDRFPTVTASTQKDLDDEVERQIIKIEQRAATAFASISELDHKDEGDTKKTDR